MNSNSTTDIRIELCHNKDIWNDYLAASPDANFYQQYEWKNINETAFGHKTLYLSANRNSEIVGALPMVFIKSAMFGRILSSMPFVNFGGLIANDREIEHLLLEQARKLTRETNADFLEIRSLKPISESLPSSLHKISMTIDLDDDPDRLWSAFKSKHRTNIRRVYKHDVHVREGSTDLLDEFYRIMAYSWRNLGTPFYKKRYFEEILANLPDQVRIFVAYQGEKPIATAFNGYFKDTVEGMWAGALPGYRQVQPNYVLYWEMIKDACEKGFRKYHLGRSSVDSGAEAFKSKWNAYSKQLHMQYVLNRSTEVPRLNVDNPKYQLAIRIWRKLPLPIVGLIGPQLSKCIP
jgi:FemAB-related protein (PEP-CTERM system-associated)